MISKIYHLSETAITIEWGNSISDESNQKVIWLTNLILKKPFIGFVETVPAYSSLTVYYRPELIVVENESPLVYVKKQLENLLAEEFNSTVNNGNEVRIPVCYEEEFGLDLEFISQSKGISKEDIIALHQSTTYKVYMMGFLPGFSYMGKVNDLLATARKPTPRARIEKGAVGIAGNQTGIYPLPSPGGWQIIGSTPLNLFDLNKQDPFLFKSGDNVTFYSITKTEYNEIKKLETSDVSHLVNDKTIDVLVLKPGVYSTIQDKGRFGFRAYGVPSSGAMDSLAHNIANALVGNAPNTATIECTIGGLKLQFNKKTTIAITGGGMAFVNGVNINRYLLHIVLSGDVLEIQYNEKGIRTYIAVSGGFLSNEIMNSQSATPIVSIGSSLKKGDSLQLLKGPYEVKKQKVYYPTPFFEKHKIIRLIEGPEYNWMSEESSSNLYNQKFKLSNRCDRMGFHLAAEPLILSSTSQLLSTAVTKGTIQLTPNGQLIVLMNDCQTTGGYPRVGQIATVDLDVLAQLKPGETINFKKVSVFEAERLYLNLQNTINGYFN